MEAGTAEQAAAGSTVGHDPRPPTAPTPAGNTIAELLPRAVTSFGEHVAIRHKQGGAWLDVTYAELGEIVEEIALGLLDLGIQPGERVCILAGTRPEWTYADLAITAAGAVVVPVYQTNSPEECHWVISDSGACAIVCENAEQLTKVAAVRDRLPELRTVVVIDADGSGSEENTTTEASTTADGDRAHSIEAIPLAQLRARGRGRAHADGEAGGARALERRRAALTPEDPYTFIYTSGTTGPPKGCVLSHGNYCAVVDMVREIGQIHEDEVTYLFLPLAHAFALLIQLRSIDRGSTIAYFGRRRQADRRRAAGGQADLPALGAANLREDLRARHGAIEAQPPEERAAHGAGDRGRQARTRHARPRRADPRGAAHAVRGGRRGTAQKRARDLRRAHAPGRHRRRADRARDPRVLLGLRRAGARGVRDDRDLDGRHASTPEDHRFGTVGRALPGVQLRIATTARY